MRSLADRAVEIELVGCAGARELAQAPQRDLGVARAELERIVEVLELAPVPDFHGTVIAVLVLADAHAGRIVAMGAERRGATRADPFVAALVATLLFGETLAQALHQLLVAERLDLRFLLLRQIFFGELLQPVGWNFRREIREPELEALEDLPENAVELVEIALVLHQRRAGEKVEILYRGAGAIALEGRHQREIFAQGGRDTRATQGGEEGQEHAGQCARRGRGVKGPSPTAAPKCCAHATQAAFRETSLSPA